MKAFIIVAILIAAYIVYNMVTNYEEISYAKSDIDGNVYMIRRGHNKSAKFLEDSANTLAEINKRVEMLINYLEANYSNDITKYYFIKKLRENYNYSIISEAAVDPRYTTYTVDKNDMHICLRTRDSSENIYDINTLMYVILHEISHMSNYTPYGEPIEGHGNEFKYIFKFYVEEAIKIGIYNYTNYVQQPIDYCGIKIQSSII